MARSSSSPTHPHQLKVFYGTQTGTAKVFAEQLALEAERKGIKVGVADLKDCDPEDCLTQQVGVASLVHKSVR